MVAHQEDLAVGDGPVVCPVEGRRRLRRSVDLVAVEVRLVERPLVDVHEAVVADLDRVAAVRR